jgi:hypothetical protein
MSFVILNLQTLYAALGLTYVIGSMVVMFHQVEKTSYDLKWFHTIGMLLISPIIMPWLLFSVAIEKITHKIDPSSNVASDDHSSLMAGAFVYMYIGAHILGYALPMSNQNRAIASTQTQTCQCK